jgi:TOBE domain
VIRSRTYAGGRVEYLVEAAGAQVVVRAPEAGATGSMLEAGSDAWVRFPVDAAVLVDDDNAERAPQAAEQTVESVPLQEAT